MPLWRIVLRVANLAGLRLGGAAIGLVTQLLLARTLAEPDMGVVLMAMSATSVISLFATLGYPALTLTSAARYLALGRDKLLDGFKAAMARDTLAAGTLAITAALAFAALAPASPALRSAIVFGCLAAPAASLLRINSALANSWRRFALSYVPDFLFRPGLLLAVLTAEVLAGLTLTVAHVLWPFVAICTAVAAGQAALLGPKGLMPRLSRPKHGLAPLLRGRALALAVVFAVSAAFGDLVTLVGGLSLAPEDVATLGIAVRLAALAGFVTQASQQLALPDLALALARSPRAEVDRLLMRVNVMALTAIMACVAVAVVAGKPILGLFGPQYQAGHIALILFMAGQAVRAASGFNQHLLSIGGHQRHTAGSCLIAVVVLALAAAALAPALGVTGVALASLFAEAVWAALLAVQAGRHARHRGDIIALLAGR